MITLLSITCLLLSLHLITSTASTNRARPTSYAALGDSYASGDGAGSSALLPNLDLTCGRFSDAYPVQIANSTRLSIAPASFRNLACGGASTTSVLALQAPRIGDSDVVTLTVGGNEVDFFVLLNECVQQWRPFSSCENEMSKSRGLIESSAFIRDFEEVMRGTKARMRVGARLLVTGYATFFNERTDLCDGVSFSTTDPGNLMTKELRRRFNDLVRLLNDVVWAAAEVNGVEFVDLDAVFEGHRFCEEGVVEPNPGRRDTWFFNMEYDDLHDTITNQPEGQAVLPKPIKDFFDMTRVFHPTGQGHEAIAERVVEMILGG